MSHPTPNRTPWREFLTVVRSSDPLVTRQFDPTRVRLSTVIIDAIADLDWLDPTDLPPLYDLGVDLEALDTVATRPSRGDATGRRLVSDGSGGPSLGVVLRVGAYLLCCDPALGVVDIYDGTATPK